MGRNKCSESIVPRATGKGVIFLIAIVCSSICLSFAGTVTAKNNSYEIRVHGGEVKDTIEFFKSKNFWGENTHEKDLDVPRIILAVASKRWEKEAQKIPVPVKKELFYRSIVPLVLLANELILEERQGLKAISEQLSENQTLSTKEQEQLQRLSQKYGVQDVTPQKEQISALFERVDTIPPSLALGQAAYESGYGTSRFAVEGNALFGQWTYTNN